MIRYLNTVLNGQRETIDQMDSNEFDSYKEFKKAQQDLFSNYCLAGGHGEIYWSQRACKGWND